MTVTEVLNYVRRLQNEFNAQSPNWSDAELFAIMENKSNQIASLIGLIEAKDTSLSTIAGTADYDYPSNFIRIRRLRVNGIALKYITFRQFEDRTPQGSITSGTPREWTQWNEVITLFPTPDTSSLTITIFGEKQQSAISSVNDTIDIPSVFHQALCDMVAEEMYLKDLNSSMMDRMHQRFQSFHLPAMQKWAARRRRVGLPTVVNDADSNIETEFGMI